MSDTNQPDTASPGGWMCRVSQWDKELQAIEIMSSAFASLELSPESRLRVIRYLTERWIPPGWHPLPTAPTVRSKEEGEVTVTSGVRRVGEIDEWRMTST